MHAFEVRDKTFADPTMCIEDAYDSRDVRLSELASQGHLCFDYEYDFGDEWQHLVEIEKTLAAEPGVCYPRCVEGEQAGPPEDSGGSWRDDYLIEKYRDPEHEEHDEAMEWLGDNFDPDKLDLDAVNYQLGRFRKWLGRDPGTGVLQAVFAKGDLVRVKAGVTHPRYPDLPLGGWVGEVKKVVWLTPITYGIEWTSTTLNQVHPVYVKRCGRDKVIPSRFMWMNSIWSPSAPRRPSWSNNPRVL